MECMALAEIFATTIFSVKLMHHCIFNRVTKSCVRYIVVAITKKDGRLRCKIALSHLCIATFAP